MVGELKFLMVVVVVVDSGGKGGVGVGVYIGVEWTGGCSVVGGRGAST
jgi:hypothetical protein